MTSGHVRSAENELVYWKMTRVVVVAIAWLGLWSHEFYRAPASIGLTPDASVPLLVIAALLLAWWLIARKKRAATWALLAYGLINGIGGFLSVLPLSFLPFVPEQTPTHYLVHIVYALCQVPLIGVTAAALLARHSFPVD